MWVLFGKRTALYGAVTWSLYQSASAGESLIELATILNITFYKAPLVALMKRLGIPLMLRYLVLLGAFTFFLLTAFFVAFCAAAVSVGVSLVEEHHAKGVLYAQD